MNEVILGIPVGENHQRTEHSPACPWEALSGGTWEASASCWAAVCCARGLSHSSPPLLEAEGGRPASDSETQASAQALEQHPAGPGHQAAESGSTTVTTDTCHSAFRAQTDDWICHSIHIFERFHVKFLTPDLQYWENDKMEVLLWYTGQQNIRS